MKNKTKHIGPVGVGSVHVADTGSPILDGPSLLEGIVSVPCQHLEKRDDRLEGVRCLEIPLRHSLLT